MSTRDMSAPFGFMGIMAIGAALVVALANVGPDFAIPGRLFWSALPLTVALLLVPALRWFKSGWLATMRAENFLLFALVHWLMLDVLQTSYPLSAVNQSDIDWAFIAIAVMGIGICVGTMIPAATPPSPIVRACSIDFAAREILTTVLICFFLGTFNYFYQSNFDLAEIMKGLAAPRFGAPWSRGALGGWNVFLEQLQYFGFVLPSLTVILAVRKRSWLNPEVVFCILLSCIFLAFQVQGGGRRVIGMIFGAAVLSWVLVSPRISFAKLTSVIATLAGVLMLLQVVLYARTIGFGEYLERDVSRAPESTYYHVDDNFLRLAQITHYFPDLIDYVGMKQILYTLTLPVPRVLWPGKPTDPGYNLTTIVGRKNVSLTSSIVGELYASWGLPTVLLGGIVLAYLAKAWSRLLYLGGAANGRVIYALGIMVMFVGMRSMQDLVIMSYGIVAWLLVTLPVARGRRYLQAAFSKKAHRSGMRQVSRLQKTHYRKPEQT